MTKYRNIKTELDGHTFDSRKEARRYSELKLLERAGEISGLQIQVPFVLIPPQWDADGNYCERAVNYIADFVYTDNRTGKMIVEDTKGMQKRTDVYIIKRKLMLKVHGIKILET